MALFPYVLISMVVTGVGAVTIFRAFGLMPPLSEQLAPWLNHHERLVSFLSLRTAFTATVFFRERRHPHDKDLIEQPLIFAFSIPETSQLVTSGSFVTVPTIMAAAAAGAMAAAAAGAALLVAYPQSDALVIGDTSTPPTYMVAPYEMIS